MILVDTSVWVDHFRRGNATLESLLLESQVMCHDFVVGELACGNIKNRREILELLQALPKSSLADNEEVLDFVDTRRLFGRGLAWVDVHLIASALLSDVKLWTLDKPLSQATRELGIHFAV